MPDAVGMSPYCAGIFYFLSILEKRLAKRKVMRIVVIEAKDRREL